MFHAQNMLFKHARRRVLRHLAHHSIYVISDWRLNCPRERQEGVWRRASMSPVILKLGMRER